MQGLIVGNMLTDTLLWMHMQDIIFHSFFPFHINHIGQRLHLNWLLDKFSTLPPDADEESIRCYCRAYILQLIGGCLFADKSNSKVHLMFLLFLKDFDTAGTYSWGSACLAWLYRELCRASHIDARDISGPLIIFQLWLWDRFPFIAPQRLYSIPRDRRLSQPPLGTRYI